MESKQRLSVELGAKVEVAAEVEDQEDVEIECMALRPL